MAATTITRATITDDSGSGTDGTIINSAWVGTAIYDKVDALMTGATWQREASAAAGTVSTITKNTSTTGVASVIAATSASDVAGMIQAFGPSYSTSNSAIASSVRVVSNLSGGLSLVATDASGILRFYVGGETTLAASLQKSGGATALSVASLANGTGAVTGQTVAIGRNTSGSGAPGCLILSDKAGTAYYLWVDTTGDLRIGSAPPEEDGTPADTSGTVVGTQS
jgi:hypothetical protein